MTFDVLESDAVFGPRVTAGDRDLAEHTRATFAFYLMILCSNRTLVKHLIRLATTRTFNIIHRHLNVLQESRSYLVSLSVIVVVAVEVVESHWSVVAKPVADLEGRVVPLADPLAPDSHLA